MKTVAVTGASSQLGVFLLPRLLAAGYRVDAYSRKVKSGPVEVTEQLRWMQLQAAKGARRVDALVSCGPLTLTEEMLSADPAPARVVAFSSTSVQSKVESPNRRERKQMAAIRTAEERLQALCGDKGVGLLLLRPTLIYGCGLDRNISLLARFGRKFGFIPVAGNAAGLRQPLHADDLAALATQALGTDDFPAMASPVCGGSTLSYLDMVMRIAASLDGVRAVALPAVMLQAATGLARLLPAYRGVNAEMVRRQAIDLVFDDSALRSALGFEPRPFRPTAADFAVPPEALAYQLG